MKPSEQFAELKAVAEKLEQSQDKEDILALFQRADKLHDTVKSFKGIKNNLADWSRKKGLELEELQRWREKWLPLLDYIEKERDIKIRRIK